MSATMIAAARVKLSIIVWTNTTGSISNPARIDNVSRTQHGDRLNIWAVPIATLWTPNPPIVTVSKLRRNLEALLGPRPEVGVGNFGELAPLELLAVSNRRGLVS